MSSNSLYWKKRKNGICIDCDEPALTNRIMCNSCRIKRKKRTIELKTQHAQLKLNLVVKYAENKRRSV